LFDFGLEWYEEFHEDQLSSHKRHAIRGFLEHRSSAQLKSLRNLRLMQDNLRERSRKVTTQDGEHWVRELRLTSFL
jgi:hypothetical protein